VRPCLKEQKAKQSKTKPSSSYKNKYKAERSRLEHEAERSRHSNLQILGKMPSTLMQTCHGSFWHLDSPRLDLVGIQKDSQLSCLGNS
jgi:hypothetical protein